MDVKHIENAEGINSDAGRGLLLLTEIVQSIQNKMTHETFILLNYFANPPSKFIMLITSYYAQLLSVKKTLLCTYHSTFCAKAENPTYKLIFPRYYAFESHFYLDRIFVLLL